MAKNLAAAWESAHVGCLKEVEMPRPRVKVEIAFLNEQRETIGERIVVDGLYEADTAIAAVFQLFPGAVASAQISERKD